MPAGLPGVIVSVAVILLTQATVFLLFAGVGLMVRRAFGLRNLRDGDWFIGFWMGLAIVVLYLLLWHDAGAISAATWPLIVVTGLGGVWMHRADLVGRLAWTWREHPGFVVALAAVGLWVADLAMGSLTLADDSVGYHLQSIRWANAAPVVPGLANLHGPLGFTSATTLYHALMRATPWGDLAHHVAGSTLVVALLAQGLFAVARVAGAAALAPRLGFDLMLLPAAATVTNERITTLATDLPTMLVMLAAFSVFYRLLSRDDPATPDGGYDVVTVSTLLTLAVAFKFGTAVVAVLSWALVVGLWIRWTPQGTPSRWRPVGWATALSAALAGAWIARSLLLSGYPVFPNTFGAIDVVWRVPVAHAQAELGFIVHSGRGTAPLLGTVQNIDQFWVWFPRWLPRMAFEDPFGTIVPMLIAAIGSLRYAQLARAAGRSVGRRAWLLLLPFAPGVVAWLIAAPEPRYLRYLLWTSAAVGVAQALAARAAIPGSGSQRARRRVVVGACGLALLVILADSVLQSPVSNPITAIVTQNLNRVPVGEGTSIAGTPEGTIYVTRSGLELFVPAADVRHCFNAPQPCTPNPAPNLRLLHPDDPAGGFAVDGDWQMIGWPVAWLPRLRDELLKRR